MSYRAKINHIEEQIDRLNTEIKKLIKENLEIEKNIAEEELFAEEKRPKLSTVIYFCPLN